MDSGNIGDLDHAGHTDQATTQVVSEEFSEPKNELWAQTPKAPSRTDEASPTVAAQQNLRFVAKKHSRSILRKILLECFFATKT